MPGRQAARRHFVWRRFLRRLMGTLVTITLLTWLLVPVVMVGVTLHAPRIPLQNTAQSLPFPAEDVAFRTRDGLTLRGWLARAGAGAPVILLAHGYPANREQMIPQAAFLYEAGYSVLLLDFRAWGTSDGDRTTFGLRESDDLSAAMDYLTARSDLGHPRFGGLGVSLGAGLMVLGAAHDHRL
ncbi:MAG TPA: alpha/beta fold hydrolase, partial [Chloroflexia bacterium]|nr:alpha/beta fold hydrolase [Chloroflexia bacterium]